MTSEVWVRHTNQRPCWTRLPVLPLLCLAIWARVWMGRWCAVLIRGLWTWTLHG
ncbi:MAG: DUF6653 family protein [Paracoccaceae bacterium]